MSPADPVTPPNPPAGAVADEPLFEHTYDGIQEYDNPMPRWWVAIFWGTIAWALVYVLNVVPLVGPGRGWLANYVAEMDAAERKYAASRAPLPTPADETLLALAADPAAPAAGRTLFMTNCMPCHGADAGGVIGPNLTDDFWIHGAKPGDIHRVIASGVLDKGMPAWATVLAPDDVNRVAAYVLTVHGTKPANPKAPQGSRADVDDRASADGEREVRREAD